MFLLFDTETTGLPITYNAPLSDANNWPRVVQLAWQLHDTQGNLLSRGNHIVRPDGFTIPYSAEKVHGISTIRAQAEGKALSEVIELFRADMSRANYLVGHNIEFDILITGAEMVRLGQDTQIVDKKRLDTKDLGTDYCALPGGKGGKFKWPSLTELHQKLFGNAFGDAHDAGYDVDATARCFFELLKRRITVVPEVDSPSTIAYEAPVLEAANFKSNSQLREDITDSSEKGAKGIPAEGLQDQLAEDTSFVHLHNHSRFSVLQASSEIKDLVKTAKKYGMPAVALTDHGNMYGVFQFVQAAHKEGIKPIVGCEFNLCKDRLNRSYKDDGFQVVLLAKNKVGYHNLSKLTSISFIDGFYYVPRIDREVLLSHREGLIALSGGLFGEIASLVLNVGETQAEEAFSWWKENFGNDFFAELTRHGLEEEDVVNRFVLTMCAKYDVPYIAANNTFYIQRGDAEAHDILLCVKDGELSSKPKKFLGKKGREFRFGFPNDLFYFRSPVEMKHLFRDLPEAILNTLAIAEKCESYRLEQDVLLPKFEIPAEFKDPLDEQDGGKRGENAYLRHLTYEGAVKRYGEITDELRERLDFELSTIENAGYPGYFLIVQDFTSEARNMGVAVGPGRGSAAGSAVAYCTGITNVDPIKYDLLFERFLNPERVSMPDIDIDFDDRGRDKVIRWVIEKYGQNQVAQIITYGTMAAKSSIRDTARVLDLPLAEADRLAKMMPDIPLFKILNSDIKELKEGIQSEQLEQVRELKRIAEGQSPMSGTLRQASALEGSLRNTGIHACGVIITPSDIREHIPVATAKDSDLLVTQYDNSVVESAGLLKMDFLGLKTLTLVKDAIAIIRQRHGLEIDPDAIPLDDAKTYELFQRGETVGIFQYESDGMQKHLRALKPDKFEDLIAMNALYRPGPLKYIPDYIARKHGRAPIVYDLPEMEEFLKETYGITVYQEQVMLLSQKLAGFTKGKADELRKAMGKKKRDIIDRLYPEFLAGCTANGHPENVVRKIWSDWEDFASYAFNKSHSTCYAYLAFQTAWLKANYPAEYMASVLSNNMSDIKQVSLFMEECRRMGVPVQGPCVNESFLQFTVNRKGEVRFGLGAVKGVGENAVEEIVRQREENGLYNDCFDLAARADLRMVNKRTIEGLIQAGGFDTFGVSRSRYFAADVKGQLFTDNLIRYGNALKEGSNSAQASLFGEDSAAVVSAPPIPEAPDWSTIHKLNTEKEVVGIFISGHPLDDFAVEIRSFCSKGGLALLAEPAKHVGKEFRFGGIVAEASHKTGRNGQPYGMFTLEDYESSQKFFLFGDDYARHRHLLETGWYLFVSVKVQMRKREGGEEPEFKVQNIELLPEIREKKTREIQLSMQLESIDNTIISKLSDVLSSHKGKCRLKFVVTDGERQLVMSGNSFMVNPDAELMKALQAIPDMELKLTV
jgi:DNA polymerase-3 subunit alpha